MQAAVSCRDQRLKSTNKMYNNVKIEKHVQIVFFFSKHFCVATYTETWTLNEHSLENQERFEKLLSNITARSINSLLTVTN